MEGQHSQTTSTFRSPRRPRARLTDTGLKQFRHIAQKLSKNQLFCHYALCYGVASILKNFNYMKEEQVEEVHNEFMNECRRTANYFGSTTFNKLGDSTVAVEKIVSFMKVSKCNIPRASVHERIEQQVNDKLAKKFAPAAVAKRNAMHARQELKQDEMEEKKLKKYGGDTPFVPNLEEGMKDEKLYEDPNWKKRDISWVKNANVPPGGVILDLCLQYYDPVIKKANEREAFRRGEKKKSLEKVNKSQRKKREALIHENAMIKLRKGEGYEPESHHESKLESNVSSMPESVEEKKETTPVEHREEEREFGKFNNKCYNFFKNSKIAVKGVSLKEIPTTTTPAMATVPTISAKSLREKKKKEFGTLLRSMI